MNNFKVEYMVSRVPFGSSMLGRFGQEINNVVHTWTPEERLFPDIESAEAFYNSIIKKWEEEPKFEKDRTKSHVTRMELKAFKEGKWVTLKKSDYNDWFQANKHKWINDTLDDEEPAGIEDIQENKNMKKKIKIKESELRRVVENNVINMLENLHGNEDFMRNVEKQAAYNERDNQDAVRLGLGQNGDMSAGASVRAAQDFEKTAHNNGNPVRNGQIQLSRIARDANWNTYDTNGRLGMSAQDSERPLSQYQAQKMGGTLSQSVHNGMNDIPSSVFNRINENQLREIVSKRVRKALNEMFEMAQPGSISHGTMRNEDVLPRIMSELFKEDPQKAREVWQKNPNFLEALCDKECGIQNQWWESEEASMMAEELFDVMNNYAPEGHYFGAHPGDGSDYGYWENEGLN